MAHVKGSGSVSQHSQGERHGKRLGLKKTGGQEVKIGQIIIRQRGAKYKAGKQAGMGSDHTIFALKDGIVSFTRKFGKTIVNVVTKE